MANKTDKAHDDQNGRDRKRESKGFRQSGLERRPLLGERGGREGGNLARKVGTRDEQKRAEERPASVSRVRKSDETKED